MKFFFTIIIAILLFSGNCCYSQNTRIKDNVENISLYKHGEAVKDCETNFRNLFNNWKEELIPNAPAIKLLSYELVGVVKNKKSIKQFKKLLLTKYRLKADGDMTTSSETRNNNTVTKVDVNFYPCQFSPTETENYNLAEAITIGRVIYKISFKFGGQLYNHYVICDPNSYEILYDQLFDLNIPKVI